jgi:hypothetical protein
MTTFKGWIMKSLSGLLLRLFLTPVKVPLHILFSRNFSDRVIFYSIQPTDTPLDSIPTLQPIADTTYVSNGGGFLGRSGRLLVETSGSGGGTQEDEYGYQVSAGSGQGGVNLGFVLKGGSRLRIYPMLGIGGQGSGLSVKDEAGSAIVNRGIGDVIYNAALGMDFKIGWRIGLIVGVRLGFNAPLNTQERKPFTRLIVGLGWFE